MKVSLASVSTLAVAALLAGCSTAYADEAPAAAAAAPAPAATAEAGQEPLTPPRARGFGAARHRVADTP